MTRLLMVEDDRALAALVEDYLGRGGMTPEHRASTETGLAAAIRGGHEGILLDLMLPDGEGLDLCRTIRARSDVPVPILTARGEEADRIVGLEIGADDYLPKPFSPRELLARPLTGHQFDLLCALAESGGRVLTREQLLVRVSGKALDACDRSIDVHISRIRAAIEDDPGKPRRIVTLRGAGYLFTRSQDDGGAEDRGP